MLELENINLTVDGIDYLRDVTLTLKAGELNVLLGPTLSGKTSLMRVMAGLDKPDSGALRFKGESVLGKAVQKRELAMVYQQFINYPSLTVYENIASPLRVAGLAAAEIERRVAEAAALLKLTGYLQRKPANLSGGQQQRVAIARALVKRASLVLLDEPLANLDYKLREELRAELPALFAELGAVLVYATTEPSEALVLGGKTACLHEGAVEQFGPTLSLYRNPQTLRTASLFSDPPLNTFSLTRTATGLVLGDSQNAVSDVAAQALATMIGAGEAGQELLTLAVRGHHLRLAESAAAAQSANKPSLSVSGQVEVTEITGSESFVHFSSQGNACVALLDGVHPLQGGEKVDFVFDLADCLLFDAAGQRVPHSAEAV